MALKATTRLAIAAPPMARAGMAPPGAPAVLPITFVSQTENNWCWAACAAMLFTRPGYVARSQCNIASTHWGQACCPSPGSPRACDLGEWPHVAYPPQGIPTAFIRAPMSQAAVTAELAAGRPVEVCYHWSGGNSTHVALIVGQNAAGDFEVYDPSYGAGSRSYSQIASAYGLGTWIYSFTF